MCDHLKWTFCSRNDSSNGDCIYCNHYHKRFLYHLKSWWTEKFAIHFGFTRIYSQYQPGCCITTNFVQVETHFSKKYILNLLIFLKHFWHGMPKNVNFTVQLPVSAFTYTKQAYVIIIELRTYAVRICVRTSVCRYWEVQ